MTTTLLDGSLPTMVAVFAAAGLVIVFAGTRLARIADDLADQTGIGEAIVGALLLGGTTSLPGIVTSVTAAWNGYPELAISNAIGGIAAQTAFLGIADIAYRRANLEHAAASLPNLVHGATLVCMLSGPLIAYSSPDIVIAGVSIFSPLMLVGYVAGLMVSRRVRDEPLWTPSRTEDTQADENTSTASSSVIRRDVLAFAALALVTGAAGYILTQSAIGIGGATGISQTVTGGLLTAVVTSLPELVTAIAAVRRGALTLAVGGIIGGNAFDVLFLSFADVAYRPGSLYESLTLAHMFVVSVSMLMSGILVMGLLTRERKGPGGIGFESVLILALYAAAVMMLATS